MLDMKHETIAAGEGGDMENQVSANGIAGALLRDFERSGEKIILPRRPGESRFGPQPYYYPASPSGVVPRLTASRDHSPAPPPLA